MAENKNLPLSVILEEARKDYVNAIQSVTKKYNLPAYLAEPIMAGIYADVRMQKMNELANDYASIRSETADVPEEKEDSE